MLSVYLTLQHLQQIIREHYFWDWSHKEPNGPKVKQLIQLIQLIQSPKFNFQLASTRWCPPSDVNVGERNPNN